MEYLQLTFKVVDTDVKDMLIAELSGIGFDGFVEAEDNLLAYIPTDALDKEELDAVAMKYQLHYEQSVIKEQNWNAEWERDFEPVVVSGFCTVRADFHKMNIETPYEVIVTPKMSFGTGHHATTQLMIQQMQDIGFDGKTVLDFGTGTGILAILAEKLGAAHIEAIDNDEWSYDNAIENVGRNNCNCIKVSIGSLENIEKVKFDIILANINRHILLEYMNAMYSLLFDNGVLLMSGLLVEDESMVKESAIDAGFKYLGTEVLNNWISMKFVK